MPAADPILPLLLNTPEFLAKWAEYVEYRRQRRLPRLVPMSIQKQWSAMEKYGPEVACKAIEMTIANSWQGIFLERAACEGGVRGSAGTASLGALQIELQRVLQEINDLRYPGGCAWPAKLEGQAAANLRLLETRRDSIRRKINSITDHAKR